MAAVLVLVAGSCDKVPLLAPSDSTVTLTINQTTLPVNGTASVTATVVESAGTSVQNGTLVTFTSNLGTFDPAQAETAGGRATVTYLAGARSGTALLSASSGGNRSDDVEVLVGGAAAEQVVVRVEPPSVPVTGGTVAVTSVVTDVSGNALSGAPVVFSSDNGTLSSSSGLTDANGEARVSLTTNRETIVTANVAGREGTATIRAVNLPLVTITQTGSGTVAAGTPVSFTLTTPAPPAGTVTNPIVSLTINFGDGHTLQVSPSTTTVTHAYNTAGTYTVTARAEDSAGLVGTSSASVVVLARAGIAVNLFADPNPVAIGERVTLDAVVTFPAGVGAVRYDWDLGDGTTRTTTGDVTEHVYSAPAALRTVTVTVTATDGGVGTATIVVNVIP